jgi:hypothetical protein
MSMLREKRQTYRFLYQNEYQLSNFLYVQIHQLLHVWREEKITLRQRVLLASFRPLDIFLEVENNKYQLGLGMA